MKNKFLKYRYLGKVIPEVPDTWKPVIMKMLFEVDSIIRPWYLPRFVLNLLADNRKVGNNSFPLINSIHKKIYITQIKQKFGSLRVYGEFPKECDPVITTAINTCKDTCEYCGVKSASFVTVKSWVRNLCDDCKKKAKE